MLFNKYSILRILWLLEEVTPGLFALAKLLVVIASRGPSAVTVPVCSVDWHGRTGVKQLTLVGGVAQWLAEFVDERS